MLLLNYSECSNEVGLDESGRGCLAGPVTAAAVILPEDFKNDILNDSKLLTKTKRNLLRPIIEREALDFNVQHVFPEDIDAINILNASIKAMHLCLANLKQKPEFIIVDGNQFKPYNNIPHATIIKGDSKYSSIAAASVLAKTYRDAYMLTLHKAFPQYGWDKNKGYPTKFHKEALIKYGVSPYHRKSFKLLPNQLKLDI